MTHRPHTAHFATARAAMLTMLCLLTGSAQMAKAQGSSFTVTHQSLATLPGEVRNLSILDEDLYCFSSDILLKAKRSGEHVLGFWADTTFAPMGLEVEYVVRQPKTGDLYLTMRDKNMRTLLYRYREGKDGKKGSLKRIKMNGMSVEHPAFTNDGNIMVFASRDKKSNSFGGYDLWYARFERGHWSRPQNLGNRLNTSGDELSPTIFGNCLFFSTNGRNDGAGKLDIYSTRLLTDRMDGDTVGMLPIGRSRVQRLPYPINSDEADDAEFWFDGDQERGYWVTTRNRHQSQIYSFSGPLDGVMLWGRVTDNLDTPLEGVTITVLQKGKPLCKATTLDDGSYSLYLKANQTYELSYSLGNFFSSIESLNTGKQADDLLFTEMHLDINLDHLPLNKGIHFYDLYGLNADVNLSKRGNEQLEPLVRYLIDNPATIAELTLYCDLKPDATFNAMLTERRLRSLEEKLLSEIPATVQLTLKNGCAGTQSCTDGTGRSQLTAILKQPSNN